ncbi:MAG: sialate O-acetylesterase [Planctomycetota bacterium]
MTRPLDLGSLVLGSLGLLLGTAVPAAAEVTPADIFGDHMALQAGVKAPIFGTTEPGGSVIVSPTVVTRGKGEAEFTFTGAPASQATADENGRWQCEIGPFEAGQELLLIVLDADDATEEERQTPMLGSLMNPDADLPNKKIFTDVLAGDVWLCSGQSNMAWQLQQTIDGDREIQAANDESIRLFTVPRTRAAEPRSEIDDRKPNSEESESRWVKLSPEAASRFSAVGYHFGKTIRNATGRPVGLIDSSWGGTPSEAWTRPEKLAPIKSAGPLLERWANTPDDKTNRPHHRPGVLNNGMIAPLVPVALSGAIWYQGESNAGRAEQYDDLFPAMIEDWREQFGQELPFFWVQLANFKAYQADPNTGSDWAELREAQDNTLDELPNVGQAVILDIGEARDIHPRNKADVGKRLALAALESVYGVEGTGQTSPRLKAATIKGRTAVITFETDGDSLQNRRDAYQTEPAGVLGFTVAGADRTFSRATAEITGPNEVTVTAPEEVKEIAAVRYGWADNPQVTLFNTRGLPAAPFRTDDWPGVTDGNY